MGSTAGQPRRFSRVAALALLLLACLPAVAPTQDSAQNATREAGGGSEGAGEGPPDVWVAIGIVLAAAAVGGNIWTGWQLRRHVDLVRRDGEERLRPVLAWTRFGDRPHDVRLNVLDGGVVQVRIANVGQVAAMGITTYTKCKTQGNSGWRGAEGQRRQWGALAPGEDTEMRLWVPADEWRQLEEGKALRFEIDVKYGAPDGRKYELPITPHYDKTRALFMG